MRILLVNDDGINSPGLRALHAAFRQRGHFVATVAPEKQHSGSGHSLTVFEPLLHRKIEEAAFDGHAISGTPADCVKLALGGLLEKKPNLVVSGINLGPNVGPDLCYSGTVAAAAEAAHGGIPAMAISHLSQQWPDDLEDVATHAARLAEEISWKNIPPGRVINVNYPACPLSQARGPSICGQSPASWENSYEKRMDPRGRPYWWLTGSLKIKPGHENCDLELLLDNHITISPLKFEYTDMEGMDILKNMQLSI